MFFQHPKRDIAILVALSILLFLILLSIPFAVHLVRVQYARAAKGVVDVRLSPDERKSIEKEIISIHNAIQKGSGESETAVAKKYIQLGELYEKLGYLIKASDAYTRALKEDERNTDALLHRGSIAARVGDRERSKNDFEKALALEPARWESYVVYALVMARTFHDPEEARGIYLKGLVATVNNRDLMRAYADFLDTTGAQSESAAYRQELAK